MSGLWQTPSLIQHDRSDADRHDAIAQSLYRAVRLFPRAARVIRSGWRAVGQPRHADRADGPGGEAVPCTVPRRPARDRIPALAVVVDPARGDPAFAAETFGACLFEDLDRTGFAAALRQRSARRRAAGRAVAAAPRGTDPRGAGDALRQALGGADDRAAAARRRAAPAGAAAVSAVFGDFHRLGAGRAGRQHQVAALATGTACGQRLPRRPAPNRGAGRQHRIMVAGTRPRRSPAALVPRHPRTLPARGRSVFLPVPGYGATVARTAGPERSADGGQLPVASRARAMAAALH